MDDNALRHLFDIAHEAATKAYAPYSQFSVGAAIRTSSGKIYSGANVENASYPLGSCAEASAISAMIGLGEREIADIAIVSLQHNPCYPCGGCRQRIFEFATHATRVHVMAMDHNISSYSIADLLPHAFGPHGVNKDQRP
jgi:cytidine deaminase